LSGVSALKERVIAQEKSMDQIQRIVLEQQRELAELKGQLKALIGIQGQAAYRRGS
jgi:uncharacterized coiled-coil protein SlyX